MKLATLLSAGTVALVSVGALAQPVPARKFGLATYLQGAYAGLKANITQAAEKMPEGDYAFKPGPMAEVRTFGQVITHIAEAQFTTCAAVQGLANPNEGKKLEQDLRVKPEIVKALADSFTLCDGAFAGLTDETAMEFVKQGPGGIVRGGVLSGLLAHSAEMYGISTVYLREKGIVPPSTERALRRR